MSPRPLLCPSVGSALLLTLSLSGCLSPISTDPAEPSLAFREMSIDTEVGAGLFVGLQASVPGSEERTRELVDRVEVWLQFEDGARPLPMEQTAMGGARVDVWIETERAGPAELIAWDPVSRASAALPVDVQAGPIDSLVLWAGGIEAAERAIGGSAYDALGNVVRRGLGQVGIGRESTGSTLRDGRVSGGQISGWLALEQVFGWGAMRIELDEHGLTTVVEGPLGPVDFGESVLPWETDVALPLRFTLEPGEAAAEAWPEAPQTVDEIVLVLAWQDEVMQIDGLIGDFGTAASALLLEPGRLEVRVRPGELLPVGVAWSDLALAVTDPPLGPLGVEIEQLTLVAGEAEFDWAAELAADGTDEQVEALLAPPVVARSLAATTLRWFDNTPGRGETLAAEAQAVFRHAAHRGRCDFALELATAIEELPSGWDLDSSGQLEIGPLGLDSAPVSDEVAAFAAGADGAGVAVGVVQLAAGPRSLLGPQVYPEQGLILLPPEATGRDLAAGLLQIWGLPVAPGAGYRSLLELPGGTVMPEGVCAPPQPS